MSAAGTASSRRASGLRIVIPMAGHGARFRDAGFAVPKPLIDVHGEPMLAWACKGLPLARAAELIVVTSREVGDDPRFRAVLTRHWAGLPVVIHTLDAPTQGQACTVLTVRERLPPDAPLIVHNADTYQRSAGLEDILDDARVDGALSVFEAPGDRWSFVRTDADGRVVETAEKRRISDQASTGLYYFRRAGDFLAAADAMIAADERVGREFYVAPIYNRLVAAGARIVVDRVDEVGVLGTPEDLAIFLERGPWRRAGG